MVQTQQRTGILKYYRYIWSPVFLIFFVTQAMDGMIMTMDWMWLLMGFAHMSVYWDRRDSF